MCTFSKLAATVEERFLTVCVDRLYLRGVKGL